MEDKDKRASKDLRLVKKDLNFVFTYLYFVLVLDNQRTDGPVNAHLISWPSKAQNIQNLEKYMVKK